VAADLEIVRRATAVVGEHFLSRFTSLLFLLPDRVPTPGNRRFLRAVGELEQLVYRIIDEGRADRGDLLSLLQSSGLSPREIRDEVMTFFLAGHETTSLALTWSLLLLGQHPDAWARLRAEVADVLGDEPPSIDALGRLPFTRAVLDEALRLYPPAYLQGRQALRDVSIGGHLLRRSTTVLASQWLIHHDERFFAEPWAFQPERWLDGLAERLPRFAYFPFGGGQRQCIGAQFAQVEAQLVLASIAQRVDLTLGPHQRITPQALITLRPREGVRMRVGSIRAAPRPLAAVAS
jgi:cytochrome P450